MLTLTPVAAEAVRQLVDAAPVDDEAGGIRITAGESDGRGHAAGALARGRARAR